MYYVVEPAALILVAVAIWSAGSNLYFYPVFLALTLIGVRNDEQLWLYLKAHEIPDGKMLESAIKTELQAPARNHSDIPIAQISDAPVDHIATDSNSVFERLSPDLQTILMKDRYADGEPLR